MDERQPARELYWRDRDGSTYRCPGCGRPRDAVDGIEVHHRDHRKHNSDPNNLIGLCRDCHQDGQHNNRRASSRLQEPRPRGTEPPTSTASRPGF
ncbi:HNH endonuclease [Natrialba chahannaoensis JCM 10990]|uniref:HNH endonuclease n=1 Tax=Natrialba chahannaoensis JCM 10990 TaxID=1227492 RepID=M0AEC1_9EURY|nr:HNH endonuclease signature motif containing protein [Natrialba chahannaoensis]ELY96751.1 HNH endonuclease [Natrialba chahannaoensis JCM 10990]